MNLKGEDLQGRQYLVGVALTSLTALMLQVALTRIFSVSLWHHLAFLVVSIAFLGYGASGTFLMFFPRIRNLPLNATAAKLALLLSVSILVSYGSTNRIPFDPARIMWDQYQYLYLFGYYGILAVPFFFAGLILAIVYSSLGKRVGPIYSWDLAGAGLGSVAILWLYAYAGEAGIVVIISLVAAAASLVFSSCDWRWGVARGVWIGLLCLMLATKPEFLALSISPYKPLMGALRYPNARLLETRRDPSGRLDIVESGAVRFAPGLSLEFQSKLPAQLGLCLDGGQLNAATAFRGDVHDLTFTTFLPVSLPYVMREPKDVLITDPMGGLDVLVALYHGARNIVATHSTTLVLKAMQTSLKEFSGHLYESHATPVQEQARSFLLRRAVTFDVIQLSLTDSTKAVSSGLYGLSEEYTLTVEAFKAYLSALKPQGILAVTQYLLPPPRHEIRLVGLARTALEELGIKDPERYLGAIRSWGTFTLVVQRQPLGPHEVRQMKDFCRRLRFDLVYYPHMPRSEANVYNQFPGPLYYDLVQEILGPDKGEAFYDDYLFDVRPVRDDRPFFYHHFRMAKAVSLYRAVGNKWQLFLEGGYLIYFILFQALVISLVLAALPLKKKGLTHSAWFLLYFGLIGLAFMLTEICLIQRFILFLARPTYAFPVVLFSVLCASSLGSYYSERFVKRLPVLIITPLTIILYAGCLDSLSSLVMGWALWIRYGATFFVIFPLGFTMGLFFPTGIRTMRLDFEGGIPWAWSINSCASVVGAVLSAVVALSYGFTAVLCLAAFAYSLAIVLLFAKGFAYHGYKNNPK